MNEDKKRFLKISGTVIVVSLLFIVILAIPKINLTGFLEVTASALGTFWQWLVTPVFTPYLSNIDIMFLVVLIIMLTKLFSTKNHH